MLDFKKIYILLCVITLCFGISNTYADEASDYAEYLEYKKFKEQKEAQSKQAPSSNTPYSNTTSSNTSSSNTSYNNSKSSSTSLYKNGSLGFYLGAGGSINVGEISDPRLTLNFTRLNASSDGLSSNLGYHFKIGYQQHLSRKIFTIGHEFEINHPNLSTTFSTDKSVDPIKVSTHKYEFFYTQYYDVIKTKNIVFGPQLGLGLVRMNYEQNGKNYHQDILDDFISMFWANSLGLKYGLTYKQFFNNHFGFDITLNGIIRYHSLDQTSTINYIPTNNSNNIPSYGAIFHNGEVSVSLLYKFN